MALPQALQTEDISGIAGIAKPSVPAATKPSMISSSNAGARFQQRGRTRICAVYRRHRFISGDVVEKKGFGKQLVFR